MKVLVIAPSIVPDSGWGRYSLELTKALCQKGIEISVVAEDATPIKLKKSSFLGHVYNCFLVRKMAKTFDVVHSFEGWPHSFYAYWAILGTKKKFFITGVGTYSVAPLDAFMKGFLLRIAYQKAQMIFCISSYTEQEIKKRISYVRTCVIHLGLTPLKVLSKSENQFRGHYPVILTVGALKERKGQFDTTKAIAILKAEFPTILYLAIGSQADMNYVDKITRKIESHNLKNNVSLIARVSDRELASFYDECDVFALNSNNVGGNFEGFGLVILEANQFGKPAVGSRNCGIEDAIREGVSGYLSDQSNAEDIAEKIRKALTLRDTELIKAFAESFSWEKTANAYQQLYQS